MWKYIMQTPWNPGYIILSYIHLFDYIYLQLVDRIRESMNEIYLMTNM
jgi:hypothetical protein